jgi:hypothetical protein
MQEQKAFPVQTIQTKQGDIIMQCGKSGMQWSRVEYNIAHLVDDISPFFASEKDIKW